MSRNKSESVIWPGAAPITGKVRDDVNTFTSINYKWNHGGEVTLNSRSAVNRDHRSFRRTSLIRQLYRKRQRNKAIAKARSFPLHTAGHSKFCFLNRLNIFFFWRLTLTIKNWVNRNGFPATKRKLWNVFAQPTFLEREKDFQWRQRSTVGDDFQDKMCLERN